MTDFNWIFWIVAPIIIIYFLYHQAGGNDYGGLGDA